MKSVEAHVTRRLYNTQELTSTTEGNNSRAKKWDAMTLEEQDHYRKTTTDNGNKR